MAQSQRSQYRVAMKLPNKLSEYSSICVHINNSVKIKTIIKSKQLFQSLHETSLLFRETSMWSPEMIKTKWNRTKDHNIVLL